MKNIESYIIFAIGILFACIDLSLSIWFFALAVKGIYMALTIFGAVLMLIKCIISFIVFYSFGKSIFNKEQSIDKNKQ